MPKCRSRLYHDLRHVGLPAKFDILFDCQTRRNKHAGFIGFTAGGD